MSLDDAGATVFTKDGCNSNIKTSKKVTEGFFFGRKDVFDSHLRSFGKTLVRRYGPLSLSRTQLHPFHVALSI